MILKTNIISQEVIEKTVLHASIPTIDGVIFGRLEHPGELVKKIS